MANVYQKDGLTISAGSIYGDVRGEYRYLGCAKGGKVVKFNGELELTDDQKAKISSFVAEAAAAPEN